MFNKSAKDPLCYSHINLINGYVDDEFVSSMIRHADKELRSLKLGRDPCLDKSTTSLLTGTCLAPLFSNRGFSGNLLETLHLYNTRLDYMPWCEALLACSNLIDLKIVGFCAYRDRNLHPLDKALECLSRKCEHLFIETNFKSDMLSYFAVPFWRNCPNITSLSFIGFSLNDTEALLLITRFLKLKYLNLSRTAGISGSFLRFAIGSRNTLLETLILRDCIYLVEEHILLFLDSLLK